MHQFNRPGKGVSSGSSPKSGWRSVVAIGLAWAVLFIFFRFILTPQQPVEQLSYTAFKHKVATGRVAEITMTGNRITGKYKNGQTTDAGKETPAPKSDAPKQKAGEQKIDYRRFETVKPDIQDSQLLALLEQNNVTVKAEVQERSWLGTLVVTLLPWVLIIGLFFYASKKFQQRMGGPGGKGGIFGFGKSKARLYDRSQSQVTFEDVAGLENTKKELMEVVAYLKDPSKFEKLGGELPRGILLVGPPGVGKTLMARATAGEAQVPFYSISGSEFIEMFVGVGASRVRDMFKKAKKEAPTIIFIDELDSIGRMRGSGLGGGHDEREQTLNQILNEMDGFSPHESVMVLAATNRPDVLDPALVRPGRFDRQITLDMPQKKARHKILKIHTRDMPLAENVDLAKIAERTVGFSGADLKNLVNEAALMASRHDKDRVEAQDFDRARDKIMMGVEREDVVNEQDRKIIAYHEAGHALMALLLPNADALQKVTIIPRGRALGATEQVPDEERKNIRRTYLNERLAITLGGRAAEQIAFDDMTSGAADDLKKATQLARNMVTQWGMSPKIGPVAFRHGETNPFLGREMATHRDYSEHTAQIIDDEVRRFVSESEQKARKMLQEHKEQLDRLAEALLAEETLSRQDVEQLLADDLAN